MKPKSHSHLPFAALTDAGLVRSQNEDNLSVMAFAPASELVPDSLLCVLCDGVGGHQAGETASAMAVESITAYIKATDGSAPDIQLTNAIQSASERVWQAASQTPELKGMASTAACAWILGRRLFLAYVGDSRIYLIKRKAIQQISIDHTWLQEAVDAGLVAKTNVKGHPNAHVIKRFVGSETPPNVDTRIRFGNSSDQNLQGMPLESGDVLFMCSDGITDLIQDAEIAATLKSKSLEKALEALKTLAYQRGAKDNLSMIAVRIPANSPPLTRKLKFYRLMIFAIIVLAAAFIGIYWGWLALAFPK